MIIQFPQYLKNEDSQGVAPQAHNNNFFSQETVYFQIHKVEYIIMVSYLYFAPVD